MNVLIINLAEATDRLAFQQKQMLRLGLNYEVLKAISTTYINETTHCQLSMGWERPLRRTELACFLSHHKAWQWVLKKNQPTLILEDDALLSRYTPILLNLLAKRDDCDLITLEVRGRQKIVGEGETLIDEFKLLPLYQDRTGAAAYILWPQAARILLEKASATPAALADAFISSTYELRMYQIEPAAALQLDQCEVYEVTNTIPTVSSILAEAKPKPTYANPLEQVRFKFRRLASQTKMGLRHLSVLSKAQKRSIQLRPEDFV
ncbi:MAG: glycosyltransferase family 25 protein [Thiothrix sp.]|nr:MAG: glycosyltransferase family 25 protein [Thiothrix sp.]